MGSDRTRLATLTALLAVALAAAPVAAQSPSPGDEAGVEPFAEAPYVPVVSKGFQHQFWQAVRQGAEQMAEDLNMEINFIGPASEAEVAIQIEMLQAEYDKNPAAVCFAALDSQAANPLLEQMAADGIPVVGFDSGVDSDIPVSTAATDNVAAAALAADKMAELIDGEGKVGVIVHDQTSRTGIDRRDGFVNQVQENYPEIEIIGPQYGGGDHLRSTDLAKAMIQANPDIKGFFGANEGSAIGVVNAVNELGMAGDLVVIGYDSGQAQIDAINSGLMAGAITQNPIGIGAECVRAAAMAIQGMEVPEEIDTGFFWYDQTNIDDPEIQAVLYQ
jgi:ribose transport system substrate-binding protein